MWFFYLSSSFRIFQYWYANQTNNYRWVDSLSNMYRLECGMRQGGLTFPKLFNLYRTEVLVELSYTRVGCLIDIDWMNDLSHADDMRLLSPDGCYQTVTIILEPLVLFTTARRVNISSSNLW